MKTKEGKELRGSSIEFYYKIALGGWVTTIKVVVHSCACARRFSVLMKVGGRPKLEVAWVGV